MLPPDISNPPTKAILTCVAYELQKIQYNSFKHLKVKQIKAHKLDQTEFVKHDFKILYV